MKRLIVFLFCSAAVWAAPVATLQFLGPFTGPEGFENFLVDGSNVQLLCDDIHHSVPDFAYQANVDTLTDLSDTLLAGNPQVLLSYQHIAILDLRAIQDPTLAPAVVQAIQAITDPFNQVSSQAAGLLSWVATQNPGQYDLAGFRVFANRTFQEQTGFVPPPSGGAGGSPVPEPDSDITIFSGLAVLSVLLRKRLRWTLLPGRRVGSV